MYSYNIDVMFTWFFSNRIKNSETLTEFAIIIELKCDITGQG